MRVLIMVYLPFPLAKAGEVDAPESQIHRSDH